MFFLCRIALPECLYVTLILTTATMLADALEQALLSFRESYKAVFKFEVILCVALGGSALDQFVDRLFGVGIRYDFQKKSV